MKVFVTKCQASVTLYNHQFFRGNSPKCVSLNKNVYRADTFVKHFYIYVWNISQIQCIISCVYVAEFHQTLRKQCTAQLPEMITRCGCRCGTSISTRVTLMTSGICMKLLAALKMRLF